MKSYLRFLGWAIVDEWKAVLRNKLVLFVLLAIPIIYPPTVSYLYQNNTAFERPTIVIDQDNSKLSRTFTTYLQATQEINITGRTDSLEEGWDAIKRRGAEMLVFIPPNFSSRVKQGKQAPFKVWVNTANIFTYGTSLPGVYGAVGTLNAGINAQYMMKKGVNSAAVISKVVPIASEYRNLFHPSAGYGDFVAPGILMMVIYQLMLIGIAFSIGFQRTNGTFREDAPHPFTYMLGKVIAQSVFYLMGTVFIFFVIIPGFNWSLTSVGSGFALFVMLIIAMIPFTVALCSLFKDHLASFEFLMFMSTPAFLMSGFTWPFDQMPVYLQWIASALPLTPALQAWRIVTMKSAAIADIVPYLWWMAALFAVYFVLAMVMVRQPWKRKAAAETTKSSVIDALPDASGDTP